MKYNRFYRYGIEFEFLYIVYESDYCASMKK